jgi:hypothetical protein
MKIADPLDFLMGKWSITRSIYDHLSGTSGLFEGSVVYTEREPGDDSELERRVSYEESGELRFGTHTGEARRHLEYVRRSGTGLEVLFADGRPFIHLDLGTGAWQAIHPCRDDHHEIVITVPSRDQIRELWRVRGPETDYEASALLTRLADVTAN